MVGGEVRGRNKGGGWGEMGGGWGEMGGEGGGGGSCIEKVHWAGAT